MHVANTDATLGAVVSDVDLRCLSDRDFVEIEGLWHERGVVVFKAQHLSDDDHVGFSARFGRFERGLRQTSKSKFANLSNVAPDGSVVAPTSLQVRFQLGNAQWHSDSSYKRVGAKASLLRAKVVPSEGGETEWADMRAAWDALDPALQARLNGKVAVHSFVFSHAWHGGLELLGEADLRCLPPIEHPVVATHPHTGRRSLFVGRHASHIVGEDEAESRALLRQLTDEACQAPRVWKHHWEAGDLAMWDNRCLLHRGHSWPEDQARNMVRTTIAGDDPTNEWALS